MDIAKESHQHIDWQKQIPFLAKFMQGKGQDERARLERFRSDAHELLARHPLKISVIIPVWNREHTVVVALKSIFDQLYQPYQVIVVDDGSEDRSVELIETVFASQLEVGQLMIFKEPHGGVCAARNKGMSVADGDLLAYLDSDNVWTRDYLLFMAALFSQCPQLDTAYAAMKVTNRDRQKKYILANQYNRKKLLRANYIDLNAFTHRRCLYHEYGGFDEALDRLVDWELVIRYTRSKSSPLVPFIGVHYLVDSKKLGNISTTKSYSKNCEKIYALHHEERVHYGLASPDKTNV